MDFEQRRAVRSIVRQLTDHDPAVTREVLVWLQQRYFGEDDGTMGEIIQRIDALPINNSGYIYRSRGLA